MMTIKNVIWGPDVILSTKYTIYGMARLHFMEWTPANEWPAYMSDRKVNRDKRIIRFEYQLHGNGD